MEGRYRKTGRGRSAWHECRAPGLFVLSRSVPVRFDFEVRTDLPGGLRLSRLARQIRQDLWRALAGLRGFSPAVRLEEGTGGVLITVGGAVAGRFDRAHAESRVAEMLADPARRARWVRWARKEGAA